MLSYVGLSAFAFWVFICFICVGLFGGAWFDVGFGFVDFLLCLCVYFTCFDCYGSLLILGLCVYCGLTYSFWLCFDD